MVVGCPDRVEDPAAAQRRLGRDPGVELDEVVDVHPVPDDRRVR